MSHRLVWYGSRDFSLNLPRSESVGGLRSRLYCMNEPHVAQPYAGSSETYHAPDKLPELRPTQSG